ncbi:MAG: hypothetical protein KIS83_01950 [Rubrivivax sp.]|nr:hypothetical protein [Rubrivivax sp.]
MKKMSPSPFRRPLRTLGPALALCAAALLPLAVQAGDTDQRVEITASRLSGAALVDRGIDQRFALENGRVLSVAGAGESLSVRYGRRAARLLRHDGQGRFVSADGLLALQIEADRFGDPDRVRLSMPASWL